MVTKAYKFGYLLQSSFLFCELKISYRETFYTKDIIDVKILRLL